MDLLTKALILPLRTNPAAGVVFVLLASAVVMGALLTITRRNPVSAVMSLVFTFFALAAIYASLSAHFLAVLQVAVYAGAIMVLFIFVVMILNRDEVEPVSWKGIIPRAIGVVFAGYMFLTLARLVIATSAQPLLNAVVTGEPADIGYGSVATVGASLFRDFMYPFEAISLLLLVAVVGGVVVSRSAKQEEDAAAVAARKSEIRGAIRTETRIGATAAGPEAGHGAGSASVHH